MQPHSALLLDAMVSNLTSYLLPRVCTECFLAGNSRSEMVIYAFSLSFHVRACFFIYLSQICLCFIPEANIQIFFFTLQMPLIALISSPLGILVAAKVESIGLGGSMNIFLLLQQLQPKKSKFPGICICRGVKENSYRPCSCCCIPCNWAWLC